jgi:protein-S-isoprenylcysteine O-methyltransferase Ste14
MNPREQLTGEHRLGDAGQIILACLFAVVWAADSLVLRWTTVLNAHVPLVVRVPVAVAALVLAAYLSRAGLKIVFGEKREKPEVIRKGVFRYSRHPVYLGEILLYFGLLMLNISLAAAAVWLMTMGFLHYISRHEERLLLVRFDEEYRQYMREVPMWIPRLRRPGRPHRQPHG